MNENLNLVELLKDCPKGTKLYSPALGECTLEEFFKDKTFPIQVKYKTKDNTFSELFTKEGYLFSEISDVECMLFPSKDQRDWSKWQRPFKDGDILAYMFWHKPTIYVYREGGTHNTSYYVAYSSDNNKLYTDAKGALSSNRSDLRFATEEEKKKLFDIIKEKGYKWNSETKTLEKLIEPKFKVGDTIRAKDGLQIYNVTNVTPEHYSVRAQDHACVGLLSVMDQDNWILIPNKFNPKTLQPFDKVLVSCNDEWFCDFFSHYDDAVVKFNCICTGGCPYDYCIPYNDDTKHLIGKTIEDAPEFYRYWEN